MLSTLSNYMHLPPTLVLKQTTYSHQNIHYQVDLVVVVEEGCTTKTMVAFFCHHLSDNCVDLSDSQVIISTYQKKYPYSYYLIIFQF